MWLLSSTFLPITHFQQYASNLVILKLSPETLAAFNTAAANQKNQILVVPSSKEGEAPTILPVIKDERPRTPEGKLIRNRPAKHRKIKIVTGMKFGDLIIRRKLPPKKDVKPSLRERWKAECVAPTGASGAPCGTMLEVPKYYLIRNHSPKTHCGCRIATIKSKNKREYLIWMMIHTRTENPKHVSYKHYAAKGLRIYSEWHKDHPDGKGFDRFLEHVGKSPTQWHTLDRIDNNKGYIPNNLRWATSEEQRANQGDRIGGKTIEEIEAMGLTVDAWIEQILNKDSIDD